MSLMRNTSELRLGQRSTSVHTVGFRRVPSWMQTTSSASPPIHQRPGVQAALGHRVIRLVTGSARATLNVARGNASAQKLYEERGWKQDDQFYMYHRFPENHS